MASRKSNCLTCATSGELLVGHALDAVTQGSVARHWHADWGLKSTSIRSVSPIRVGHGLNPSMDWIELVQDSQETFRFGLDSVV